MSDVRAVLTEALAGHRPYGLDCRCGRPINSDADWARHMADVLLGLSGVAVIQLPEPTWQKTATDEENGANAWEYPDGEIVVYETGDYEWRAFGINHDDPSRLRDAAAALLAAAVLSGEASGE